jgi:hypothetical protein
LALQEVEDGFEGRRFRRACAKPGRRRLEHPAARAAAVEPEEKKGDDLLSSGREDVAARRPGFGNVRYIQVRPIPV